MLLPKEKPVSHNEHILVYNALHSVNKLEKTFIYQCDLAKEMFWFLLLNQVYLPKSKKGGESMIVRNYFSEVFQVNKPMKSETHFWCHNTEQWGARARSWTSCNANA